MNSESPQSNEELLQRLSQLEAELRLLKRPHRSRGRLAILAAIAVGVAVTGTALAANGNCPNGLPFCFAPDQPAIASQVNHNFAQLKEWLEAKVGTVGSSVSITTPAVLSSSLSVTGASVLTSVSASGAATVAGLLSANGGLNVNGVVNVGGSVTQSGFQSSCITGLANNTFPICCRIDIRTGATSCKVATSWSPSGFTTGPADPFVGGPAGAYSLTCYEGVSGQNFPACCRTDSSGTVTCRGATSWQLTAWTAASNAF